VSEVQSLARGLRILDMLALAEDGISVTELAQRLGVDKSSASRLLQTLASQGYAQQDSQSRRYYLGTQIMVLSRHWQNRMPLRDYAKPFLYELVEQTGEAAHIAIYAQGQVFVVEDVETTATLRVSGGAGRLIPLHCTALGKCLLAFTSIPIPSHLPRMTRHTITQMETFMQHLEAIRQQGYALDDEELDEGVRCLAVPVYDYSGKMVAAMGISGPAVRVTVERAKNLSRIVIRAGESLSRRLGYHPPQV
jgi:IclR family transcriptional regulator, KDG regulon repressor